MRFVWQITICTAAVACLSAVSVYAQVKVDPEGPSAAGWKTSVGYQMTGVRYSASLSRYRVFEKGVSIDVEHARYGGISGGSSSSRVSYNNGQPGLDQDNISIGGRVYQFVSSGGRITYRLDGLRATSNDPTQLTDNVYALAPKIGYLNLAGTAYYDFGFVRTNYPGALEVKQYAPTLGFALNDSRDWVQFRPLFIRISDSTRALDKGSTSGLNVSWTHFYGGAGGWMPVSTFAGGFVGNKVYAVDPEGGSIGNLGNVQRSALTLGASWKYMGVLDFSLFAGTGNVDEPGLVAGTTHGYKSRFVNLSLSASF
ncbi:MAG: hypothetical protein Q7R45_00570 [Sulfuricaulis sp.]|nr:hypothetical protein [Sulfuricaulis sp.]